MGLPAVVIVAAALVLERRGLVLRWAWTRQLGNASYAIYLSHFFVPQAVILVAVKLHLHGPIVAGRQEGQGPHRLAARGEHHDEAADDEEQVDAGIAELQRAPPRPGHHRQGLDVHEHHHEGGQAAQGLDIEERRARRRLGRGRDRRGRALEGLGDQGFGGAQ